MKYFRIILKIFFMACVNFDVLWQYFFIKLSKCISSEQKISPIGSYKDLSISEDSLSLRLDLTEPGVKKPPGLRPLLHKVKILMLKVGEKISVQNADRYVSKICPSSKIFSIYNKHLVIESIKTGFFQFVFLPAFLFQISVLNTRR